MRANGESGAGGDAVGAELTALLARLGELADGSTDPDGAVPDAARVDRIGLLERLRGAVASAQHTEMVAFARSQVEAQLADERVDPRAVGRGIGDQIGLAAHVSPWTGSRRLGVARALHADLPNTRALLTAGRIHEELAEHIVAQTSHLEAEQRRQVDAGLAEVGLDGLGRLEAEAAVKRTAYEADRAGYVARGRTARADRRVTLRPAPDTMSRLSVLLPAEQGLACRAALQKHADALRTDGGDGEGDERTRDQVMVDTLVERVAGQARAEDVDVEVNLVIPWDALHPDPDPHPDGADGETPVPEPRTTQDDPDRAGAAVELLGYGPIPAAVARDILASSRGRLWWRRLFTAPAGHDTTGALIGGDPRRRRFDGFLATLIGLRDHGRCRDPFCDAPIRHLDHIRPARAGGPTSYTNGRGVCARGNFVREMPGWRVETVHDGLHGPPHTARTTTPTGHTYTSRAGPAP